MSELAIGYAQAGDTATAERLAATVGMQFDPTGQLVRQASPAPGPYNSSSRPGGVVPAVNSTTPRERAAATYPTNTASAYQPEPARSVEAPDPNFVRARPEALRITNADPAPKRTFVPPPRPPSATSQGVVSSAQNIGQYAQGYGPFSGALQRQAQATPRPNVPQNSPVPLPQASAGRGGQTPTASRTARNAVPGRDVATTTRDQAITGIPQPGLRQRRLI